MSGHRLAVLGGGSWGTALALTLSPNFASTSLWVHDAGRAEEMAAMRRNERYLPGFALPDAVRVTNDLESAVAEAGIILIAVPSAHVRAIVADAAPFLHDGAHLISAAKGLETGTMLRMSEVISEAVGGEARFPVLALSGPSFAREVAAEKPTAVVIAGEREPVRAVQCLFATPYFRTYASSDLVGVEIGGALKNVVAIGSGIAVGLDLGHNAVSALITRGLAEITRLATRMGAQPRTLSGLSGLGDLVLTCTGELSRNRQVGLNLSKGISAEKMLSGMTMVAEGIRTAAAAVHLGAKLDVELPVCQQMDAVLDGRRSPEEAIRVLMDRALKEE